MKLIPVVNLKGHFTRFLELSNTEYNQFSEGIMPTVTGAAGARGGWPKGKPRTAYAKRGRRANTGAIEVPNQ